MTTIFALRAPDGRDYPVTGVVRFGRAPESTIQLSDDLVSRQHASAWVENGRLLIRDDGSSNGTQVNGRPLPTGSVANLRPGDQVNIGASTFTVVMVPASGVTTAPLPPAEAEPAPPLGATRIEDSPLVPPAPLPPPPSTGRRNLVLIGCLVIALLIFCGGLGVFVAVQLSHH